MTAYEQQIMNTSTYYNHAINLAEAEEQEVLSSYVPGDQVHEKIHNPVQEGIDEG